MAKIFVEADQIFSLVPVTSTLSSVAEPHARNYASVVANLHIPRSVPEIPGLVYPRARHSRRILRREHILDQRTLQYEQFNLG
jgi:hypothetical protein